MAKRIIDYGQLIKNYDQMIDTLEYDSMRSPGKAKLNAEVLWNMQQLKEFYIKKNSNNTVSKKETVVVSKKKEAVNGK